MNPAPTQEILGYYKDSSIQNYAPSSPTPHEHAPSIQPG